MNYRNIFSKSGGATLAGILAVIMWSSSVAATKTVMTDLGTFKGAFYVYLFGGLVNFLILLIVLGRSHFLISLKSIPYRYYLHTGVFFILNNVFFYVAIGLAHNDKEILIVALLNYLWPVLIFIFRVPIYHSRIIPWLFFPAIAAAISGISIALLQGYTLDELFTIVQSLNDNFLAFLFAFLGAASWALYSNLIRKYKTNDDIAVIPVILVFTGILFFIILIFKGEAQNLSLEPVYSNPNLIYTFVGPTCLGYLFWYLAMKHGNRNLVTSLSYLIPLGSVYLISVIRSFPVRPMFWVSAILLVLAALLGMKAVKD
jgi:drug/metabolite transporter (DMT)-like permease